MPQTSNKQTHGDDNKDMKSDATTHTTSMQQIEDNIQNLKTLISTQKKSILEAEKRIREYDQKCQGLTQNKVQAYEQSFKNMYGVHPDTVRKNYVALIKKCSGPGGKGRHVRIPGVDLSSLGHHFVLLEKHYRVCKPTPLIEEAFAVKDQTVWIEPTPHCEVWGN